MNNLSLRQQQVASLVCQGLSNKRIGLALGIGEQTVKNHLCTLFNKTNCNSRLELALLYSGSFADLVHETKQLSHNIDRLLEYFETQDKILARPVRPRRRPV